MLLSQKKGPILADGTERTDFDSAALAPRGLFDRIAAMMAAIGTISIFLTMAMIVADVLGRNFFNRPITGVAEVAGRAVVAIVFLQIAAAVASGRMTRADFLINIVKARSSRMARALELLNVVLGAGVFALIAAASWPDLLQSWRSSDFFGVQGLFTIPTWPFWTITVIGSIAAGIAYLLAIIGQFRQSGRAQE
jgi:TRAP-type C4-dicarboxylate transport system permease small subunit